MKKLIFSLFFVVIFFINSLAQNNLPYPVIFIHGLLGGDDTFKGTLEYMRDSLELGEINVFDILLNGDNNKHKSLMSEDVKWEDFYFSGKFINLGKRTFAKDVDDFEDGWTPSNIFAINFNEKRIRGASEFWNDHFDFSNQAAIFKQGYALKKMIIEVLDYTGAEKVILVGHSMGGMCIKEYLQRTDENGVHINWVDPSSPDGHKVARVVTYGTPHLGSNTGFDVTTNIDVVPNQNTEAMRDMRYSYKKYPKCKDFPQGIYLFGGNERCLKGSFWNPTFVNLDINCDGDENDDIIGVCQGTTDNPAMPLPTNIRYTYNTSIFGTFAGLTGDGAVAIDRQWLYDSDSVPVPLGLADTLFNTIFHTREGDDYKYVIRGLDEPERFDLAYTLDFDRTVIGFIALRSNSNPDDTDVFQIETKGNKSVGVTIQQNSKTGIDKVGFYDENNKLLVEKNVAETEINLIVNVPNNVTKIFLKIHGNATATSWKYPYKITFWVSEK